MGIFNGITTWVENIVRPRGFTPTHAGTLGALMLAGGILGAIIIPPFSDKQHKRQRYLLLGITLAVPGLIGLTFATSYWALLLSAFTMGFFLVSTSPVGMQYAAEVTYPTPEGTSNGLIQLFGQASGFIVHRAHLSGYCESRGHRYPEIGHLGEIGPFSPEDFFHVSAAFSLCSSASKEIQEFFCHQSLP